MIVSTVDANDAAVADALTFVFVFFARFETHCDIDQQQQLHFHSV